MAICRLCLGNKKLVNSHIFPEFMYKPLYDKDHKFNVLEINSNKKLKKLPKGIYEKLLCQDCDHNIIGKYENHASNIMFGDGKKEIKIEKTDFGFLISGIDYTLFKLFQISILWRSSVSNRPEISKINLGYHQEVMRQMLLKEYPSEYFTYGVQMYFFPKSTKRTLDLILSPILIPKLIDGHEIYRVLFNGICWFFVMSGPSKRYENRKYFLSKDGKLPIVNSGSRGEHLISELVKDFFYNIKVKF